mmetsp:Transcript_54219/g.123557  ORF Transcript_54219/g.123557 Transcript_54219/m.123557 type:complete len:184 (-) Transcript_54219:596-1147(-)
MGGWFRCLQMLVRKKIFFLGVILALQMVGGLLVCGLEGWPFVKGIYWAFQTTFTIGYGDCALTGANSRVFAALYALLSVGALGGAFAGISGAKKEAEAEKHFRKLMRQELDPAMIARLDRDGDGVDRAEFVLGMLVAMDCVSERECAALLDRFDKLDADGSGRLDSEDLRGLANAYTGPGRLS